jgi:type I restriction enzyme S subunit
MEVKPGYKKTGAGVVPDAWTVRPLAGMVQVLHGFGFQSRYFTTSGSYRLTTPGHFLETGGFREIGDKQKFYDGPISDGYILEKGDLIVAMTEQADGLLGSAAYIPTGGLYLHNQRLGKVRVLSRELSQHFLYWVFNTPLYRSGVRESAAGTKVKHTSPGRLLQIPVALPDTIAEQEAIATALSDADALIESLEQLIAKKRQIKQGAMQELLTGKRRLPGFHGEWETKTLFEVADCLDNVRVPLNESQRDGMPGDFPYCGANGVLGFVSGYVIDDDFILIAEDGGYFDEYSFRPIAYRMTGKCWVNNHAHILKAKEGWNQGFLFYSLVHKNILTFLASGTRAKLNKAEMFKIEVQMPAEPSEQAAVAKVFGDMDEELSALESRLSKARALKQGMMQELLTGRIRLV